MKVMTAQVIDGKIAVDTELEDGTTVAILAADESGFHLTAEQEEELTTALNSIRSGDFVDGRQLLESLKAASIR